jgi:transcriptional regulator with XRE-family HTH domain
VSDRICSKRLVGEESEMTTRETMARKLKAFRLASGLSAADVGDAIGKSPKTVQAWEVGRGQPDADVLMELCEVYDVRISDFFLDEQDYDVREGLTSDEVSLLRSYRSLDPVRRDVVLVMVTALAEAWRG